MPPDRHSLRGHMGASLLAVLYIGLFTANLVVWHAPGFPHTTVNIVAVAALLPALWRLSV